MMRGMHRYVVPVLFLAACASGVDQSNANEGDGPAQAGAIPDAGPVIPTYPIISLPDAAAEPDAPAPAPRPDAPPSAPIDAAIPVIPIGRPPVIADAALPPPIDEPDAAPPPLAEPDAAPPSARDCKRVKCDCTKNGKFLAGNVQFVTFPATADFKVKLVSGRSDADLRVQKTALAAPHNCGQWHEVQFSPDFTVQEVTLGEDFAVFFVGDNDVPGTN